MTDKPPSKDLIWSIGIYGGKSPFDLHPLPDVSNPILTCQDVSSIPAKFVADPFMIQADGTWYLFFEVLNQQTNKGEIGLATSETGHNWVYDQIVLSEPFHLSYPYVFEWNGEYYMTPETLAANGVRLYKATDFPTQWSSLGSLITGSCADPSVFQYDDRWWMFTCSTPYEHDTLRLYFADNLMGPWIEHPASPIVEGNKHNAQHHSVLHVTYPWDWELAAAYLAWAPKSRWPVLVSTTVCALARLPPSRARRASTVTTSPAFIESRFMPARNS